MSWIDLVAWTFGIVGGIASINQLRIWFVEWQEKRIDSFASIERHGIQLLKQIKESGFTPDFVLGLGRSGAFLAGWLAGNLGSLRIEVIDRIHKDDPSDPMEFPNAKEQLALLKKIHGEAARVLVVEGAATRGGTFYHFEKIRREYVPHWQCKCCALYRVDTANVRLEFFAQSLKAAPLKYPWHKTHEWRDFIRMPRSASLL
ncbi:MAG: hypothetical protein ACTHLR_11180 [Rhizomicrobium sp.]